MKVDFMIIGAQKSATSTLFDILNTHEKLEGIRGKEPQFFSTTKNWRSDVNLYHNRFNQKKNVLYFEGSTTYTFYPHRKLNIWDDIYEYNPNMKFIYMVRNPIDRIVSGYMHTYERGYTNLSLSEALKRENLYLDITRYATQIIPYIKKFGRKQVLIIDFDDFNNKRDEIINKISQFLDIKNNFQKDYKTVKTNISIGGNKQHHRWDNPSIIFRAVRRFFPNIWKSITKNKKRAFYEKPKLSLKEKKMIINLLDVEIDTMEKIIGKSLQHWKEI